MYCDSRSMLYLPYKRDEEREAGQLIVDMFELVPAKVAPEVVAKDVKLIYDPSTKELMEIVKMRRSWNAQMNASEAGGGPISLPQNTRYWRRFAPIKPLSWRCSSVFHSG